MYDWRKMTLKQRTDALEMRSARRFPWHGPPHFVYNVPCHFHLSAACYEHAPIIGLSPERMAKFENDLLGVVSLEGCECSAWCVLPNHWHALVKTADVKSLCRRIGQLHGRRSCTWNREDECTGRKSFHACSDRRIRNDAHMHATMNYIHHNPVHHGYVSDWCDWPYSSAGRFLDEVGRSRAAELWRQYPVLDYGAGWDDAEM